MLPYILKKITLTISHLKWAWEFLLQGSVFPWPSYVDTHRVGGSVRSDDGTGSDECSVCLCSIGGGEETEVLRCGHVFHGVCLERWAGYGRWTCPLCRNYFKALPGGEAEVYREIVVFSFGHVGEGSKTTWWLR